MRLCRLLITLVVAFSVVMISSCSTVTSPRAARTPTATSTPAVTCASLVSGQKQITPAAYGITSPMAYPPGTVFTGAIQASTSPGMFTVYAFTACSPDTTVSDVSTFYATKLPPPPNGWTVTKTFPSDAQLLTACPDLCLHSPENGPLSFLSVSDIVQQTSARVMYKLTFALASQPTTCGPNFTAPLLSHSIQYFLPDFSPPVPVPPASSTVSDNAMGGVRGFDICSNGTPASVAAFMTTELPATGWKKVASDTRCIYQAQCWTNGNAAISWDAGTDVSNWHIAWRVPFG